MNFTFEKPDWMVDAACRDLPTEWFFPGRGGNTALPKQVCARCPVRKECLDYSMTVVYGREAEDGPGGSFGTSEKYGIWGGHSER